MSRSIEGLFLLNALFLATGFAVLWALRGFSDLVDIAEHAGIALLLGLGGIGSLATVVLCLGGGLPTVTVIALALVVVAAALVGQRLGGARLNRAAWKSALPSLGMFRATHALALVFAATATTLFGFFVRVGRIDPLTSYDGWSFWVPKAKAIYFFGGLDEHLFRTLPGSTYPLFVPTLQAMDFRFMGSTDEANLALQYLFVFGAFLLAIAAIARRFAPAWAVWLFLATATAVPEIEHRVTSAQADWVLDLFFGVSALCLIAWVRIREPWLLAAYAVTITAVLVTKREGQLLAVVLVVAGLLVLRHEIRATWPIFIGVSAATWIPNLVWFQWWHSRGLSCANCVANYTGDTSKPGIGSLFSHLSRLWPSIKFVGGLALNRDMWLVPLPAAVIAGIAAIALVRGDRRIVEFGLAAIFLTTAGFIYLMWSTPGLPFDTRQSITPLPRAIGSIVTLGIVLGPLLVAALLPSRMHEQQPTP